MEKLIYPVWKSNSESQEQFNERLLTTAGERLLAEGACKLQINVVDEDVEPANKLRQINTAPPIDAVISIWVHTSNNKKPFEAIIQENVYGMSGYLVTESEPIPNEKHVSDGGVRTPGFSQIVFLEKPPNLHYDNWREIWLGSHTQVAIETQSTFRYVQNIVVRPLTYAAKSWDAMIEECFPKEAMYDQRAFYDAIGDEQKYQANLRRMMDSCARFIDFSRIDCIPMSEYIFRR